MPKVRDVTKRLEQEGWYLHRRRGSHRQYKHPAAPERLVTIAGKPNDDLPKGTWNSIRKQAGWTEVEMRYTVIIERAPENYSAYVPDLPGCVATGATRAEVQQNIREAILFHVETLKEDGVSLPEPSTESGVVDVPQ